MTLQEIFSKQNTLAQTTSTGMNSLKEYLLSVREKMMKWTSLSDDSNESIAVAVTTKADADLKKIVDIPRTVYQQCVDDIDGEDIILNTAEGIQESFSRTEIMSAIEDVMSESGSQLEFIDYVMNHVSVSAVEFTTYIKNKYTAVTNQLVEKYGRYLESGNPIQALKTYLSSINLATANKDSDNNFISIRARNEFTGTSVWSIIWTNFKNKVTELFANVWTDILHLFEFFKNLFAKIVELGKWLLSKVAKPLTTNYEKAGSNFGIMDLPIMQYYIGDINISTRGNNTITESSTFALIRKMGRGYFYNAQDVSVGGCAGIRGGQYDDIVYRIYAGSHRDNFHPLINYDRMLKLFAEALVDYDDDGNYFVKPFDVTVPIKDYVNYSAYPAATDTLVFRVAVTQDLQVYLQMFISMPKTYYDTFYDYEIAKSMEAIGIALSKIGQHLFPYIFDPLKESYKTYSYQEGMITWTGGNYALSNYPSRIFMDGNFSPSEIGSTGPIDVVSHLPAFNFEDVLSDTSQPFSDSDSNWTVSMIAARLMGCVLLPLVWVNAPHLDYVYSHKDDIEKDLLIFPAGDSLTAGYYGWSSVPPTSTLDLGLPELWLTEYRPYCNSGLIDASIHYQSLEERASEIEKYIIGAIIAIAAVVVTIKMAKFVKNRRIKQELAQGFADNMSWQLPANPTAAQVQNYTKARKKARRITKHNALLGIATEYATQDSIISTIHSISDQMLSTQGYSDDQEDNAPTMREIKRVICGV